MNRRTPHSVRCERIMMTLAIAAMATFTFAQSPPPAALPVAGSGATPPSATSVAGPGPSPVGVAGPAQAPGAATVGITGTGVTLPRPDSIGIAGSSIRGISPSAIGIATGDRPEIGIATDVGVRPVRLASQGVATVPSDSAVWAIDIGIPGALDATEARISRPLSETRATRSALADAARTSRFNSRVLIRGSGARVEIVRQD